MIDLFFKLKRNLQFDWFFDETLFRKELNIRQKITNRVNLYFSENDYQKFINDYWECLNRTDL